MPAMMFGKPCLAALLLVVATASLAVGSGCSALATCDTSDDGSWQIYEGGTTSDTMYMSSAWDGPLLAFPGGKRYRLMHHLGCRPSEIAVWVSFSEQGAGEGSSIAPSAGNLSILEEVTDEHIQIKNDTCSDMYVLVTAEARPSDCERIPDGGTGDAEVLSEGGTDDAGGQ